MYLYRSVNELETFIFHDYFIIEAQTKGNTSIWNLSGVDVLPKNSCNSSNSILVAPDVLLTFENSRYSNVKKHYGIINDEPIIESVDDCSFNYINNTIVSYPISYGLGIHRNEGKFEIIHGDFLITFNVSFSNVIMEWDSFYSE